MPFIDTRAERFTDSLPIKVGPGAPDPSPASGEGERRRSQQTTQTEITINDPAVGSPTATLLRLLLPLVFPNQTKRSAQTDPDSG